MNKTAKLLGIVCLMVGFVGGYFIGREHIKYQIRSGIKKAFKETGEVSDTDIGTKKQTIKEAKEDIVTKKIKQEYIDNYIRVYDIQAKYQDYILDGRVASVFGKIQNMGDKTLNEIEITVYFLDKKGNIIFEKDYHPVYFSDSSLLPLLSLVSEGYDTFSPLKPGYIRKFGFKSTDCPSEWNEGHIKYAITDIEFKEE